MPKRRTKTIKWVMLVIIGILGLLEVRLLAYDSDSGYGSHETYCSTAQPFTTITGRVIDGVTKRPIGDATVTVRSWHRLVWTCENHDIKPQMVTQSNDSGEFEVNTWIEREVSIEIAISAPGCQPFIETMTADSFFMKNISPEWISEFRLKCPNITSTSQNA